MKPHLIFRLTMVGSLVAALSVSRAGAQDANAPKGGDSAKPAAADKSAPSGGIAEVLKMLDAGVSKDVVKAYIESSPNSFSLAASDLITLKERGVSDDITLGLLKHGSVAAPLANPAAAMPAVNAGPTTVYVTRGDSGRIDPESYDYFQRYYLFPRTLANMYQTLGFAPSPYGFYGQQFAGPYYSYPRRYGRPGQPFMNHF